MQVHPIPRGSVPDTRSGIAAPISLEPKFNGVRIKQSHQAMFVLRHRLHGQRPKDIAKATGLSVGTIYAIRCGRTAWPRPKTFFTLLDYFGLELYLK